MSLVFLCLSLYFSRHLRAQKCGKRLGFEQRERQGATIWFYHFIKNSHLTSFKIYERGTKFYGEIFCVHPNYELSSFFFLWLLLFSSFCYILLCVEQCWAENGRMVNRIRKLVCLVAERFMCWPICIFFYVLAVSLGCSRSDKNFMCPFLFYIFFNSLANLPFWWAYHLFRSPLILIIYQAILNV